MNELLDQTSNSARSKVEGFKQLSVVLLSLSIFIVLFALWKVWNDQSTSSPWLPEYSIYFMNGALINFSIIQFGGLIPAFFLRFRKHYLASSICMIAFMLAAALFKNRVLFYTMFY